MGARKMTVTVGTGAVPPLAKAEESRVRGSWADSVVVLCRPCGYSNQMSQSFHVLGIQNLYCRRCGRLIDREGNPSNPS